MPVGIRKGLFRNSRFLLEIEGIVQAGFSEATFSDTTTNAGEYREGNEHLSLRKFLELTKYGNLTLKRGTINSKEIYEKWRKLVEQGKMKDARKNIAVILLNEDGNPEARWEFEDAWPIKYKAPDMNAKGNDIAVETLEIVHEGMKRVK